jgi:hypothetical protein
LPRLCERGRFWRTHFVPIHGGSNRPRARSASGMWIEIDRLFEPIECRRRSSGVRLFHK